MDILAKTVSGEWVPYEVKADQSKFNKLQRQGPTECVNTQTRRALREFRNWKSADEGAGELADRLLIEQADFNDDHGRARNYFNGYEIRVNNMNNRWVDVEFKDWKNR